MSLEPAQRRRPRWHADAKWIVGLLLLVILFLTLLVFNLFQVTAEEPAVETMAMTLALAFSPEGLDQRGEIEALRQQLEASPNGTIRPIPGLAITVSESDIADRSPREVRLSLFRRVARVAYRNGPEGLAALATDPVLRARLSEEGVLSALLAEEAPTSRGAILESLGSISSVTEETHRVLGGILTVLGIASLVLLLPLVFFSYRFGRLGSPALVLFFASLPGALLFSLLRSILVGVGTVPPGEMASVGERAGYLAAAVLGPLVETIAQNYVVALLVGAGLIAMTLLAGMIGVLMRR
jgi:hypothetical protein